MRRTTLVNSALLAALAGPAATAAAAPPDAATLTVERRIAPAAGSGTDVGGWVPAGAGWVFTAATATPDVGGLPSTLATTDAASGEVVFPLTFGAGAVAAAVTVAEPRRSDFAVVPQGGRNASCRDGDGAGATVPVADLPATALAGPAFALAVVRGSDVRCVVYTRAQPAPAPVVVPGPPDTIVPGPVTTVTAASATAAPVAARELSLNARPRLTLRVRASRATAGGTVRYTLTVQNLGSGKARGARLCTTLPQGLTLARHTGGRRACWTLAPLAPGYATTRRVTARVGDSAASQVVARASVKVGDRTTRASRTLRLGG